METGGTSAFQIIIWVLAANALLILTAYSLAAWLRKQVQETIVSIAKQIQGFDSQMGELGRFLQSYAGIDQEPFYTPLDELQNEASLVETRLTQFLQTCRAFEEAIKQPGNNQLQNIINAPFVWFRRWQQARELRRESETIASQMSEAENRVRGIYELPWELAEECRTAGREVAELTQQVQWLQAKGVRGVALQKIASQTPLLNQELERVPTEYLEAEKEQLLASANLDSTIRVFEQLHTIRPAIDRYLPRVREWRADFEKASAEYAGLKQAGADLRQAFSNPPPGLALAPLEERLDQVAQMASELNQRLAQPEAEALRLLARDIGHLHRVVQDTGQRFHRAGEQVAQLNKTLTQLQQGLENLAGQFSALEHPTRYPLAWDESRGVLDELRIRCAGLGPAQQPRTPDQIQQQRDEAEDLAARHKLLAEKAPHIIKQHAALTELLNSPSLQEGPPWIREARVILNGASQYDPKNWSRSDTLSTLSNDIDELERLQTNLVPADPGMPLQESHLEQQLTDTQQLAALHKSLRPRIENLGARLEKVKALEKESKEKLTSAWRVLERVAILAESNELLDQVIATEIDRMGEEIRTLGNELNARQQGEMEKKAQKIQAQAEKVNQAMNQWLASLNEAITERIKKSSDLLIQMDAVTRIQEPPIEEARTLLTREEVAALRSTAAPASIPKTIVGRVTNRLTQMDTKSSFDDLEALAEIKRKNDLWQALLAAQSALEEKSKLLLAANQKVVTARSEAKGKIAELSKRNPGRPTWPPSNQALLSESQALKEIDEKREALKIKPSSTEAAVRDMERLEREYRLAAEHAQQILDRIDQDQERIQELEWQINNLKERWQSQVEPDNPIMREGVQQLLSHTDSKISFIKQQTMQGLLSYEEVIRNLQLLYDEVFVAQVPIDEENKIRLNEPHHRAKQA